MKTAGEARQAANLGIASSAEHAESDAPGWSDTVLQWLQGWAHESRVTPFTMEEFRIACEAFGMPAPTESRAYGSVTRAALRLCLIEKTGGYAPARSSNLSAKPLYRRGPNA